MAVACRSCGARLETTRCPGLTVRLQRPATLPAPTRPETWPCWAAAARCTPSPACAGMGAGSAGSRRGRGWSAGSRSPWSARRRGAWADGGREWAVCGRAARGGGWVSAFVWGRGGGGPGPVHFISLWTRGLDCCPGGAMTGGGASCKHCKLAMHDTGCAGTRSRLLCDPPVAGRARDVLAHTVHGEAVHRVRRGRCICSRRCP